MKHLIAKYKISEAVHRQTPLSVFWRRRIDRDPELHAFERYARELDDRLRAEATNLPGTVPEGLHHDILSAVHQEQTPNSAPVRASSPRLFLRLPLATAATALVVVLVALGYWIIAIQPNPEAVANLQPPVALASTTPVTLPTPDLLLAQLGAYPANVVPDPMTAQLEALSLDAQSAARFLLNSLP